jgi:hypothetical protein
MIFSGNYYHAFKKTLLVLSELQEIVSYDDFLGKKVEGYEGSINYYNCVLEAMQELETHKMKFTVFDVRSYIRRYCQMQIRRIKENNTFGHFPFADVEIYQLDIIERLLPLRFGSTNKEGEIDRKLSSYSYAKAEELANAAENLYDLWKDAENIEDFYDVIVIDLPVLSEAEPGKTFGANQAMLKIIFDILA